MEKLSKMIQYVANCDDIYCPFFEKQYTQNGCICSDCEECFEEDEAEEE